MGSKKMPQEPVSMLTNVVMESILASMLQLTVSCLKSEPRLKSFLLVNSLLLAHYTQQWSSMAVKTTTNLIMSVTEVMPLRSVSTNTTSMMTSLTLANVPLDSERKSLMHSLIQSPLMTTNELTMINANLTHSLEMVLDAKTTPDHMNVAVISQELN